MDAQHAVDSSARRASGDGYGRIGALIQRTPLGRTALILGVLSAVVGFLGSWIPSYWGDEAASIMSAERSWPSLFRLLSSIDAVHGAYYVFLHLWIDLFGASELSTRVPSTIAVGLTVAGTVMLAGRLAGRRVALVAGIVATVLPRTMYMATEARAYSMSAAIAVWATVLLVDLLRRDKARWGWVGYAAVMAVGNYVFLYLGLLLAVHGLFVVVFHRDRLLRWLLAAVGSLLLSLPIIVIGYLERGQIGFLARRNYATAWNVYSTQWFDPLSAAFGWALILLATMGMILALRRPAESDRRHLTVLVLIWLALPTTVLLVGNALVSPMYNIRYLSFCVPAAAVLIALGIRTLVRALPSRGRLLAGILATVVIVGVTVPSYVVQRGPYAKDNGSDWRDVAAYVGENAAPGDAIVFDQKTKPSRNPRLMVSLYPEQFEGLDDAALVAPFETQSHLWDKVVPNDTLTAEDLGPVVWAVELTWDDEKVPADIAYLQSLGYEVVSSTLISRDRVYRLELR